MHYCEGELKTLIQLAIKANESHYLINKEKAEKGLNELKDLLIEYQEAIELLIKNNREEVLMKDVN